ncbi:radical SAM protein [Saccharopolyspora kobensis]
MRGRDRHRPFGGTSMVHLPLLQRVPRYVTVFVNWACNLTCRECWMYGDSASESTWLEEVKREQISTEMWTGIVDELAANSGAGDPANIAIMGGEPLMHPKIVELCRIAKERLPGGVLDMSTNGTLLTRMADELADSGIDVVYVSLDGPTAEINNPIRGRKSYERAIAGIEALQRAAATRGGPKIALNFVVTGMNYTSLPEMVRLCERMEIPELTVGLASYFTKDEGWRSRPAFEPVTGQPFLSWAGYCNEHQHADMDLVRLREIFDETESMSDSVEVLIAPTRYGNEEKAKFFTPDWHRTVRETTCTKLWAQSTLLPNGQVISCTTFADTVMGSIKGSSLSEVWHGDTYRRMREQIKQGLAPVCYRCCELNMDIEVDPALYTIEPAVVEK